jgi:hypothetical protein
MATSIFADTRAHCTLGGRNDAKGLSNGRIATMIDDTELDALFVTPPASFIGARNALASKAREAGQKDRARQIDALRKPTMVVWLINQLARDRHAEVAGLLTAGQRLREASLKGSGPAPLREANEAWRAAVAQALREIRRIAGRGIDEPRIVATLAGAVADPAQAERLARGRLTDELQPPGIEGVLDALAKAPPSRPRAAAEPRAAMVTSNATRLAEERRRREAAKELREREHAAAKARKEALRADEVAARLERRAKAAVDEAAAARRTADEAARRAEALATEARQPS